MYRKAILIDRLGWTLTEYDEQPADEVRALIDIYNLRAQFGGNKK